MGLFASTLLLAAALQAQNATEAGRFHVEHPTLLNLGFEWAIDGDANRNATVDVQFRAVGETAWRNGASAACASAANDVYRRRENLDYTVPDGFAGSILNLAARHRVRVPISADGSRRRRPARRATPSRSRRAPSRSRSTDGRTLHVYPPDHQGPRQEPSFTSLLQAYYGAGLGDWSVVWERRAQPGDTILVHAGLYKPERLNYVDPHDGAVRRHRCR